MTSANGTEESDCAVVPMNMRAKDNLLNSNIGRNS
jgi:hypothetical protein